MQKDDASGGEKMSDIKDKIKGEIKSIDALMHEMQQFFCTFSEEEKKIWLKCEDSFDLYKKTVQQQLNTISDKT